MKKQLKNYIPKGWLMLGVLALAFLTSCQEDDDNDTTPEGEDPVASFQFAVSEENFLEVTFTNYSQHATSYEWDFGDGNTSTEENPTHTYGAVGTYDVVLTASNDAGDEASRTETLTLSDPDAELTALAGTESKTWILQREGVTLGIGGSTTTTEHWSYGGVTPHAERPCILDDEYTFTRDGSFILDSKGTIFLDGTGNGGWNDTNPNVCNDEASADWTSANGNDMSAFQNGGDYTFELNGTTLTLSGEGVYIGLPNKNNDGDLGSESDPQSQLVYQVVKLVDNEDVDSLHLAMQVGAESLYWNFYLVHYDDESLMPELPSVSPPAAAFSAEVDGLTVTFDNTSTNADSYSWDFGDGNTSTEEDPTHTYASNGVYTVTLSATGAGGEASRSTNVVVGATTATEADIQGKDWSLLEGVSAVRVGPSIGSAEWWSNDQAWADEGPCLFDDTFTFNADGGFVIDVQDEVFTEGAMEGIEANGCVAPANLPSGLSAWAGGDFTYDFEEASGEANPTITVSGNGAYIGFYKGANGVELTQPQDGSITYEVLSYVDGPDADFMEVAVDISANQDGTAYWTYLLKAE